MGKQGSRRGEKERPQDRGSAEANHRRDYSGQNNEFSFKIVRHLGVIEEYQSGWSKEANIVQWNGNKAKVDIRDWDPDHEHMGRGITLHRSEAVSLMKILQENFGEGADAVNRAADEGYESENPDDFGDMDEASSETKSSSEGGGCCESGDCGECEKEALAS